MSSAESRQCATPENHYATRICSTEVAGRCHVSSRWVRGWPWCRVLHENPPAHPLARHGVLLPLNPSGPPQTSLTSRPFSRAFPSTQSENRWCPCHDTCQRRSQGLCVTGESWPHDPPGDWPTFLGLLDIRPGAPSAVYASGIRRAFQWLSHQGHGPARPRHQRYHSARYIAPR
jgi:hypothetical protein